MNRSQFLGAILAPVALLFKMDTNPIQEITGKKIVMIVNGVRFEDLPRALDYARMEMMIIGRVAVRTCIEP